MTIKKEVHYGKEVFVNAEMDAPRKTERLCPNCDTCAHKTDRGCGALTETEKGSCAFHQTPDKLAASREKANARLRELPETMQKRIAGKYYYGKEVWE